MIRPPLLRSATYILPYMSNVTLLGESNRVELAPPTPQVPATVLPLEAPGTHLTMQLALWLAI